MIPTPPIPPIPPISPRLPPAPARREPRAAGHALILWLTALVALLAVVLPVLAQTVTWEPPRVVATRSNLLQRIPETRSPHVLVLGADVIGDWTTPRWFRYDPTNALPTNGTTLWPTVIGTGRWLDLGPDLTAPGGSGLITDVSSDFQVSAGELAITNTTGTGALVRESGVPSAFIQSVATDFDVVAGQLQVTNVVGTGALVRESEVPPGFVESVDVDFAVVAGELQLTNTVGTGAIVRESGVPPAFIQSVATDFAVVANELQLTNTLGTGQLVRSSELGSGVVTNLLDLSDVDPLTADRVPYWDGGSLTDSPLLIAGGTNLVVSGNQTNLGSITLGGETRSSWPTGTKTIFRFTALDNQPGTNSSGYATFDVRGDGMAVLDFDVATAEDARFPGIVPEGVTSTNILVRLLLAPTFPVATSNLAVFGTSFANLTNGFPKVWGASNTLSVIFATNTVPQWLTITNTGAGIGAGDPFALKVYRQVGAPNTVTNDVELLLVEGRVL